MSTQKKVKFLDQNPVKNNEYIIPSDSEDEQNIKKIIKKSKNDKKSKKDKKAKKDKKSKNYKEDEILALEDIEVTKKKTKKIEPRSDKKEKKEESFVSKKIPSSLTNLNKKLVISDSDSDSNESDDGAMAIEKSEKNKKQIKNQIKKETKFSQQSIILDDTRRWEDDKQRQNLKRGGFEAEETELLMRALCQYCQENNLEESELINLVSQKNDQHKGAWSTISSVLPLRSVQACHNHCRRKFNPNNYKGAWVEEDIELLLNYVKKYGKEWEKIGVMIGRTALNVRDKYKELGGSNNSFRTKSNWTVEETLQLIKLVEKYSKIKILTDNVDEVLTKSVDDTDFAPKRISKTNIKFQPDPIMVIFSPYINYATAQTLDYKNLPWTKISEKMKSKSRDDCRNRFSLQVHNTIFQKSYFDEKLETKLLAYISDSCAETDLDIEFEGFWPWLKKKGLAAKFQQISAGQAKSHWIKMKRIVQGRQGSSQNLQDLIELLGSYYSEVQSGKRTQQIASQNNSYDRNRLLTMWREEYNG